MDEKELIDPPPPGPPETEARILRPSDSFEEWDEFVELSPQGCVFCRSWWLKAVCPRGFEVLTLRHKGRIVAGMALPWVDGKVGGSINMPLQTQTLGMLLPPPNPAGSYESNLSDEVEIQEELIRTIPPFRTFRMSFNYNYTNWQPLYWAGYAQTTHYTYVIESLADLDATFARMHKKKREDVRRAERRVTVHEDLDADQFYTYHAQTLALEGKKIAYPREVFRRIHQGAYANHNGKTWFATDSDGHMHAALFVCFDTKSAYFLIMPVHRDYRTSGAGTLLVKKSIEHVAPFCKSYDYEGSMIEGVEHSVRKMGGVQKPYFWIFKDSRSLGQRALDVVRQRAGRRLRRCEPTASEA